MINSSLTGQVDEYIENLFVEEDEALTFAIKNSKKNNLPPIQITPVIGKFLSMQVKIINAKRILELGTLGAYSTLWLAKALPDDGKIITIEHNNNYAVVAEENILSSKMKDTIEIKIGEALSIIPTLSPTFDFVFIDANKEEYKDYIEKIIPLCHKDSVIVCDNVIRNGGVLQKNPEKAYYKKLQEFNAYLANNKKLETTILPFTVPLTGRDYIDGLSISRVL